MTILNSVNIISSNLLRTNIFNKFTRYWLFALRWCRTTGCVEISHAKGRRVRMRKRVHVIEYGGVFE